MFVPPPSDLKVDVVESQHLKMVRLVTGQRDFDAVVRAHAGHLAALEGKAHLRSRPLMDGTRQLLRHCRRLSALMGAYGLRAQELPHAEVKSLAEAFESDGAYLFLLLERADAKELAQRLDFNGFFSAAARKLTDAGDY